MYKTKSGTEQRIFFSNSLLNAIKAIATERGQGVSYIVREACIKFLSDAGKDTSSINNPAGRGTRSDLRSQETEPFNV